jgi:hypothetical protein
MRVHPVPALSSFCKTMFRPFASHGTYLGELEPVAFVSGTPMFPAVAVVPDDDVPMSTELAVIGTNASECGLTPEVLTSAQSLWTEGNAYHPEIIATEMRSRFCLGPAGVIQIVTAVVFVKDERATPSNISETTLSLANLCDAIGRSLAAPVAGTPAPKATKKKKRARSGCVRAVVPEDKPVRKKSGRPRKKIG